MVIGQNADVLTLVRGGNRACLFTMPVPFHELHQAVLESMITVILDSTPPGYIASHQSTPFSVKILEMAVRLRKRCRVLPSCHFQHPWDFCSLHTRSHVRRQFLVPKF
jgi:hypothetical protein